MAFPFVIREASAGIRWEWVPRPTASHYLEKEFKLEVSIRFPLQSLRNPMGEERERLQESEGMLDTRSKT